MEVKDAKPRKSATKKKEDSRFVQPVSHNTGVQSGPRRLGRLRRPSRLVEGMDEEAKEVRRRWNNATTEKQTNRRKERAKTEPLQGDAKIGKGGKQRRDGKGRLARK